MNEASVTKSFMEKLKKKGLFVRKIADKTTQGVPDTIVINTHGDVFFLEIKFFEVKSFPTEFKAFSRIKKDSNQLMTLVEMENHGSYAFYLLIYRTSDSSLYGVLIPPSRMLSAIKNSSPIIFRENGEDKLIHLETMVNIVLMQKWA